MVKKNISEISKQIPGSLDFRIEVASACAESGVEYHTFAEQYDLGIRWSCKYEKITISYDYGAYVIIGNIIFL